MTITIKERDIDVVFKFRTELLYEDAMEKSFTGNTIREWVTYFYCTIIANTEDGFIKWDEFMDWLDENTDTFYEFISWYNDVQTSIMSLRQKKMADEASKKAKPKKAKK